MGTGSRATVETSPGTPSGEEDSGGFPEGDQAEFPEPRESLQEVSRATWEEVAGRRGGSRGLTSQRYPLL